MAKTKTAYFCQNCGAQYAKWAGQCPSCKEWNTLIEEVLEKPSRADWKTEAAPLRAARPMRLSEIRPDQQPRFFRLHPESGRLFDIRADAALERRATAYANWGPQAIRSKAYRSR